LIINRGDKNQSNARFARVTVLGEAGYALTNEGFRGMGIKKDKQYRFSIMARKPIDSKINIRVELLDSTGHIISKTKIIPDNKDWMRYESSLTAAETDPKSSIRIWFEGKGDVDIDMISLFPVDTWKNRPNGMRADLVQLLADMKPGFIRFPGGCIVEGRDLATRYQWKKTVGKPEDRELIINRWNREFAHRLTPDYFQSFGLGFYEYFQLAEDLGAAPLPILNCGMACQFNTAEVVPMDQLDPYIQDALDLIDFANGDGTTAWSKLRQEMGHAGPFNLTMIGVGNEQWGPQYIERYQAFVKAIKSKYPHIKIVTSNGPAPEGELFDYADKSLRALRADIIDEHYYNKPEWFLKNAARYDQYDRKGPKIFAGEYAAQSVATVSPENKNNWECALAEAAFMTGLERNADVVNLCSYAPLLAHVDAWQWTPDLIWFDNLAAYGTPNYYVQKLFSNNKGTDLIRLQYAGAPLTGQNGLYGSAVLDKNSNEIIFKMVNAGDQAQSVELSFEGVKKVGNEVQITMLKSGRKDAVNSIENPLQVSPQEQKLSIHGKKMEYNLQPFSFYVFRIKS
jgi:alpha-N-arabinofuranosidase